MSEKEFIEWVREVYGNSCILTIAEAALEYAADAGTGGCGVTNFIDSEISALRDVRRMAGLLDD